MSLDINKDSPLPAQGWMSPVQPLCMSYAQVTISVALHWTHSVMPWSPTSRDSLIHSRLPVPSRIPYLPSSTYYGGSSCPGAKACDSDAFSSCLRKASSTYLFLSRWSAADTCWNLTDTRSSPAPRQSSTHSTICTKVLISTESDQKQVDQTQGWQRQLTAAIPKAQEPSKETVFPLPEREQGAWQKGMIQLIRFCLESSVSFCRAP